MKNKSVKEDQEEYKLSDFNLNRPEIIHKSMQVKPKYGREVLRNS